MHFSALHNIPSCPFLTDDLDHSCDEWKLCAIGYVSRKFPGYRALTSIIENVWHCKATLSMHESGWLVYKFQTEEDKCSLLCGGPYLVYGRPLILRSMSEYFDFSTSEMTQVPVWIKFPNLPLKCWTTRCLSKLSSVLGKPIQSDKLTATKEIVSYARVLVEVDLLAHLRSFINVILPNGNTLTQKVIYETLPKFCKHCKVLGHSTGACSKRKEKVTTVENVVPANVNSKANVKGKDKVSTCLNPVDEALVDTPLAAAFSVQVPSVAHSPIDTSDPVVPTSCAAHLSPVDASETVAPNVIGKEKVSTCLNPIDDTFVDIPSAAALSVQVPSVAPFPVDTSEHVAPTHTPASCAAKDAQPCSQVSAVGSEEWHTVGKRKHNSGTKRQSPPPLHVEGNPPTHHFYANNTPSNQQARHHVSKGKAPASSVDIAGTKTLQRPRSGVLTRSSFQKISNTVAGGGGVAPTLPHP